MTNRTRTHDLDLMPDSEPADAAYDRDFYSWSLQQARIVREGSWDALDRENVAEEIEPLGREQFSKLERALRVLLVHYLEVGPPAGAPLQKLDDFHRGSTNRI